MTTFDKVLFLGIWAIINIGSITVWAIHFKLKEKENKIIFWTMLGLGIWNMIQAIKWVL